MKCLEDEGLERFDFIRPIRDLTFGFSMEGSLWKPLNTFFNIAGMPNFVEGNRDGYFATNNVLLEYNKTLKRKFRGFLIGKHVVDRSRA